jgi:hypothetical protein
MSLTQVPLTLHNFADGKLSCEINDKLTEVLDRFRACENGDIELASDKAVISVKLTIERDPKVGGFRCSFEEPSLKLPAKIASGTVAVERDGILVVASESDGEQLRLTPPTTVPKE